MTDNRNRGQQTIDNHGLNQSIKILFLSSQIGKHMLDNLQLFEVNKTIQLKTENVPIRQVVLVLTDFLGQHLQVGNPAVFEELNSVHTIKAVIFDHVEGTVYCQSLQDGAFPRGHTAFLPPGVLNPPTQKVVGVRGQAKL